MFGRIFGSPFGRNTFGGFGLFSVFTEDSVFTEGSVCNRRFCTYVTEGSVYNWHDTLPERNSWVFHKFDSIQLLVHGSYYFPHQDMMHFMDKASSRTSINSFHSTFGICCLHKRVEIMMLKDSLRPEPRRKFVHKKVISIKNLLRRGSFQKFNFNQRTITSGVAIQYTFYWPKNWPLFWP